MKETENEHRIVGFCRERKGKEKGKKIEKERERRGKEGKGKR